MESLNIVVLCGGVSTEREVSLSSGSKICNALRSKGHRAVLVDMYVGLENMEQRYIDSPELLFGELPIVESFRVNQTTPDLRTFDQLRKTHSESLFGIGVIEICKKADIVFIALHGMNGEDGRLQATFDLLGIRYTGSGYLGSAIGMNKVLTKQLAGLAGIKTPRWESYHKITTNSIYTIAQKIKTPCVIKTPTGGSSVGVIIVNDQEELLPAMKECLKYSDDLLVEEYIKGREFTCAVLKDRALPCVEIVPRIGGYNYANKYLPGQTEEICPGRLPEDKARELGDVALKMHRLLDLRTYSRSDFIVDDNGDIYFLEINTLPGMTPTSLVPQEAATVGICYEDLCEAIIQDAMQ